MMPIGPILVGVVMPVIPVTLALCGRIVEYEPMATKLDWAEWQKREIFMKCPVAAPESLHEAGRAVMLRASPRIASRQRYLHGLDSRHFSQGGQRRDG